MDGVGWVMTSSPRSSTTWFPEASKAESGEAEGDSRHFARVHRCQWRSLEDAGTHIGTAAAHIEQHIVTELLVHPFVPLGGQWCTLGGAELGDRGQVDSSVGLNPALRET